jgi:hypothetical protein
MLWAAIRRGVRRGGGDLRLLRGGRVRWSLRNWRMRRRGRGALTTLEAWADEFPARRQACLEALGPREDEVTVVCVTNRPQRLEDVVANYERQTHGNKRLVVVTNSREFDLVNVKERLRGVEAATTFDVDEDTTLGACLNLAIEKCETRFMAKFDDDDHYADAYLSDMLLAHRLADAVVVGKLSHFAYVEELDRHVLRFPGWELTYAPHVAGATLVVDLERIGKVRFPDLSVGEDREFVQAVLQSGGSVFSADCFNYRTHRGSDSTWRPGQDDFLRRSLEVGAGLVKAGPESS